MIKISDNTVNLALLKSLMEGLRFGEIDKAA